MHRLIRPGANGIPGLGVAWWRGGSLEGQGSAGSSRDLTCSTELIGPDRGRPPADFSGCRLGTMEYSDQRPTPDAPSDTSLLRPKAAAPHTHHRVVGSVSVSHTRSSRTIACTHTHTHTRA